MKQKNGFDKQLLQHIGNLHNAIYSLAKDMVRLNERLIKLEVECMARPKGSKNKPKVAQQQTTEQPTAVTE